VFLSSYRNIFTGGLVEHENGLFPQLFPVLSNFHECFYNSKKKERKKINLFNIENSVRERKKNNLSIAIFAFGMHYLSCVATVFSMQFCRSVKHCL